MAVRMSLVRVWFSGEPAEQQWERARRFLETSSRNLVKVNGMREAIEELEKVEKTAGDDARMLKVSAEALDSEETEQLIKARVNQPRASAWTATPDCLKSLRPDINCMLVYQFRTSSFQAYYPRPLTEEALRNPKIKKFYSTSRSFGGGKWTKVQALTMVVRFLWQHHKKRKFVPLVAVE